MRPFAWMLLPGLLAALLTLPTAARGAETPALDVQHFQPHGDRTGFFSTYSAETLELFKPAFALWLNYARDPLLFQWEDGSTDRVVGDLVTMDLQAAIGFRHADLAIDMPIHLRMAGDGYSSWTPSFAGTMAGDLRVIPKVRFLDPVERGIGLGLVLPLTIPTGDETRFAGRRTVSFNPQLVVTGYVGIVRLGANLGYRITKPEPIEDLIAGNAFTYSGAVGVSPHPVVEVIGEVYGEVHSQERNNPVEWLVGAVVYPVPSVGIRLGGGTAMGKGIGAPEGRIVFALGFGVLPPVDSDGDGIPDKDDECKDEPEIINGYKDDDGCPDDPDPDGDGIVGADDECPDDAEDFDGFEDEDGCPDVDNDGDRILDVVDECPDDPEVVNGVDDEDGCPDEGLVELDTEKREIIIYEKVYFELAKANILPESHRVLDAVIALLSAHEGITKLEIQGHTDKQGGADYNMKLSQSRADAVRDYLVAAGIEQTRLTAVGYGESQLVELGDDEAAHARNRRVQFIVLEME